MGTEQVLDFIFSSPLTPFLVAGTCAFSFYYINGGFQAPATLQEKQKRERLPWLSFMVFIMSLAVILCVRFFADKEPAPKRGGQKEKELTRYMRKGQPPF